MCKTFACFTNLISTQKFHGMVWTISGCRCHWIFSCCEIILIFLSIPLLDKLKRQVFHPSSYRSEVSDVFTVCCRITGAWWGCLWDHVSGPGPSLTSFDADKQTSTKTVSASLETRDKAPAPLVSRLAVKGTTKWPLLGSGDDISGFKAPIHFYSRD